MKELARFQRISSITGITLLFNTWLPDHSMNFGLRGKTTLIWTRSQLHAVKIWVNGMLFMLIISQVLRKPSAVKTLSCQCRTNFSCSIFSAYLTYIVFRIYNEAFLIHCYLDYKQWFTKLLCKKRYKMPFIQWTSFTDSIMQLCTHQWKLSLPILFVRQCW